MIAYHFVGATLRDGSPVPSNGYKLVFPHEPILCEQGLHASLHPFDPLQYAPGNILCKVECSGTILHQNDKLVCTERTIIARFDAENMLRYFARQQALSVVHLWNPPQIVLDYLMTGDPKIKDAARDTARDTARAAARDAARDGARDAARCAARVASWGTEKNTAMDAAWCSAMDAAWCSARDAAGSAARDAARDGVWSAAGAAAGAAAWNGAWDAARNAARKQFQELVDGKFNRLERNED